MRTVRRLLVAALFVAVWYFGWRFAAENASVVSINFLAGQLEGVALWAALIGAFAGGVVVVCAVMLLPMTRTRLVARRYRKMVEGLAGWHPRRVDHGLRQCTGNGVRNRERPDLGPSELVEMCARPQLLPKVTSQRSDVGALGADDLETNQGRLEKDQLRFVHRDRNRLQLHNLAATREPVSDLAPNLLSRVGWRSLERSSLQGPQGSFYLVDPERPPAIVFVGDPAFHVVGLRRGPESRGGEIALVQTGEIFGQPGRRARAHEKKA